MYGWIFRHLPGPAWLRAMQMLILAVLVVAALFVWVFPWAQAYFELGGSSV